MKKRNIVMIVILVALFVAAGVGVLVGVLTHEEAGLLTACERADGVLDYAGDCEDVTWDRGQFPLKVHASSDNPFAPGEPREATRSVIDLINGRLGFTALEWTDDTDADISIAIGVPQVVRTNMDDSHGDTSHFRREDGRLACLIRTWNTGTVEMLDKALTHELGHGLGLAHDDFEDSAVSEDPLRPDGVRLTRLRITDHDRSLLRSLYAP